MEGEVIMTQLITTVFVQQPKYGYISFEVVCCTENKIMDQHKICLILAFNGNNMSPD